VDALLAVRNFKVNSPSLQLIASGGIYDGLCMAKAIALGADYASAAGPIIRKLSEGGAKSVIHHINQLELELKGAMFLTGSHSITELQKQKLYLRM
jgi:isopentenyl-diphosphate delta-isomerase